MNTAGYDEFFKKLKDDGVYGTVSFKLQGGEVKLITFQCTYKSVGDALNLSTSETDT